MGVRVLVVSLLALVAGLSLVFAQNNSQPAQLDGAEQYQLFCAACHMTDGAGAVGAGRYPNLAGNPAVEASPEFVLLRALNGFGAMPSFRSLNNDQLAAIVNHVRGTLNNSEAVIDAEFVQSQR